MAEVVVKAHISQISLQLTPDVYNGLVNLKEVLSLGDSKEQMLQLK